MHPIEFSEQNVVFAKDQPEYLPLPAFRDDEGQVVSCWRLSAWEVLRLLVTRRLWLMQLTFNHPLQPILPSAEHPFVQSAGNANGV